MVVLRRGYETEFDKHMRLQREEDLKFAKDKQAQDQFKDRKYRQTVDM
jgi:hypothetical protein